MTSSDHLSHLPRPLLCSMHRQLGPRELTSLGLSSATRSSLFTFLLLLPVFLFRRTNKTKDLLFRESQNQSGVDFEHSWEDIDFSKFSRLSKNLGIEDRHGFFSNMHRKEPFATLRSGGLSCKVHTASTSSNHLLPISWTLIWFSFSDLSSTHWGPNFIHRETSLGFSMDCQSSAWRQSGPRIPDLI
jgi:hypothetical protein